MKGVTDGLLEALLGHENIDNHWEDGSKTKKRKVLHRICPSLAIGQERRKSQLGKSQAEAEMTEFKKHPRRRNSLDAGAARSKEVLGGFPEEFMKTREIPCKLSGPAVGAYHRGIKMAGIVMS